METTVIRPISHSPKRIEGAHCPIYEGKPFTFGLDTDGLSKMLDELLADEPGLRAHLDELFFRDDTAYEPSAFIDYLFCVACCPTDQAGYDLMIIRPRDPDERALALATLKRRS